MSAVRTVSATDFNRRIGAYVDAVRTGKETLIVANHGRPQIVVIPIDRYERLLVAAGRNESVEFVEARKT